jgi:hypothetical protein
MGRAPKAGMLVQRVALSIENLVHQQSGASAI